MSCSRGVMECVPGGVSADCAGAGSDLYTAVAGHHLRAGLLHHGVALQARSPRSALLHLLHLQVSQLHLHCTCTEITLCAIFTLQFCTCTSSCAVSGRLTGRLTHFLAGTGWQENTWLELHSSHCRHSSCQAGRHTGRGTCRHCCRYGAAYEV